MSRPWSMRSQVLVLILLSGIAVAAWSSRDQIGAAMANLQTNGAAAPERANGKVKKREPGSAPVIASRVGALPNDETVAAIGTARALRSVTLHAKSEGEVMSFAQKSGDRVKHNEIIVELDQTKAKLAVDVARTTRDDARQKLERAEYLRKRNVNSGASVEDATVAVNRAELEVRQAEEELRDKTLTAPFAGVVGIPMVEAGDRITPATGILTLDDRSELLVEFPVAEKFLSRIKVGDPVKASTPSYARKTITGRLGSIDSRVDPLSRTVMVRAVLPNGDDLLRPGMSFSIKLELPGDVYPAVPELSLQWSQGHSYVWLIEDNKVRKVIVETVRRLNAVILVAGPVKAGDLIVVEGVQRLRDGMDVSYREPAAAPDPASAAEGATPRRSARTQTDIKG